MKFDANIEIDDEFIKVLLDSNTYTLDSEYFEWFDKQDIENEMQDAGLITGGFYEHYPVYPTRLGYFIIQLVNSKYAKILPK